MALLVTLLYTLNNTMGAKWHHILLKEQADYWMLKTNVNT